MKTVSTRLRVYVAFAVAWLSAVTIGCGGGAADSGPTYADLVVVYNAELESLDRLERKKQELVAKYEAQLRPRSGDVVQALSDAFSTASELAGDGDSDAFLDPDAALDQAAENAEAAQDAVAKLLDSANQPPAPESEEDAARRAELTTEFNQQLEALDKEIEKQTQRVERARQARDDAESSD